MSSAWEQWGAKRPAPSATTAASASAAAATTTPTAAAAAAFQSLLRSSPLVAAAAESSAATATSASIKKMWDSARDLTRSAVQAASPASSTTSTVASDLDAMESGQSKRSDDADATAAADDEGATATWPLFRRKTSSAESAYLPTLSWNTRFKYFVAMALLGLMFFGMASIFLPLIVIRPSKFALSFTFGSMCLMTAFAMLKGPAAYVAGLLEPKRLALTTAYFLTLGATLYSCLVLGNYVLVVCSSLLQLFTLGVFAMSVLPGGNAGLSTFRMLFTKVARQLLQALSRLFR